MLSIFQNDSVTLKKKQIKHSVARTEVIKKPKVDEDYNNKSDQVILHYGFFLHRRMKWWERAFFHLMDVCLVNAHILYNNHNIYYCYMKESNNIAVANALSQQAMQAIQQRPSMIDFEALAFS